MTRRCKDCIFDNQNKLREVIKDVISCVDNEHTRLEQRLIAAEQSEQEASEIIAELKAENTKLKEELNRYKEMEAKGLQEFKDIGGCWGCGIQLLLNNERVNFKKCDLENKKLKAKLEKIFEIVDENRITAQYKGICTSILMIIRGEEDE